MKAFITIILFIALQSCNPIPIAQKEPDAYEGTWHYQNSNQVFVVSLWQDNEGYKGHYKMINVDSNGNQVSILYNSNKSYWGSNLNWPFTVNTSSSFEGQIGGNVVDNTVNDFAMRTIVMTLQNYNPLRIHWKITKPEDLRPADEPEFNIPTDIVLTKVSNTVNP